MTEEYVVKRKFLWELIRNAKGLFYFCGHIVFVLGIIGGFAFLLTQGNFFNTPSKEIIFTIFFGIGIIGFFIKHMLNWVIGADLFFEIEKQICLKKKVKD